MYIRKLGIFFLEFCFKHKNELIHKIFNYLHPKLINTKEYLVQIKKITNVDVIIDIGVHEGTPDLYDVFNEKFFLLVDPVDDHLKIKPKYYKFLKVGLGSKDEDLDFFIHKNSGLSSFKSELKLGRNIESDPVKVEKVKITTLDFILENQKVDKKKIGIKIDAQGSEYEILNGLSDKYLDRIEFIILENNILPRYKESKLFSEITSYLFNRNFYFLNILNPSSAIPRYAYDVVYLSKKNIIFRNN